MASLPDGAAVLHQWLQSNPGIFLYEEDERALHLVEAATGLHRRLGWDEVARIDAQQNRATGRPYVIVLLESGHQLVIADQGFAFAPDFVNTGPLPVPTNVFCMRDFHSLLPLVQQADAERKAEAVQLVMVLVALLDGARAVGLAVGEQERVLERELARLEAL